MVQRTIRATLTLLLLLVTLAGPAVANLTVIGSATYGGNHYNLIYDNNPSGSIVWLDYSNPANTWPNQVAWASSLNSPGMVTYSFLPGYSMNWSSGWQLPTTVDNPSSFGAPPPASSSQMAYLYYTQLGNTLGNSANTGPFSQIQNDGYGTAYWSGTEVSAYPGAAWIFGASYGSQHNDNESDNLFAAAVRPGQLFYAAALGAPTNATATAGIGQGTVSFSAPASDGGSPITSYTVTANPGNISVTRSTSPFSPITVTGLTNGSAYTFSVAATNGAGQVSAATAVNLDRLDVTLNGTGSGSVNSIPAGIHCTGGTCGNNFGPITPVNQVALIPSASGGSQFAGWEGACTGTGACRVTMNPLYQSVTAIFDTLPNARIVGSPLYYGLLQSAYNVASDGAVVQAKGVTFAENLTLNKSKAAIIKGGYDPNFSVQNGRTMLQGSLRISQGRLVSDHITITGYSGTVPHPTAGLNSTQTCQNCHATGGTVGTVAVALTSCTPCHTNGVVPADVTNIAYSPCANCHTNSTPHKFTAVSSRNCIGCHNVAISHPGTYVKDNSGVRAVVGEFSKWSHHVTGVVLQNAHCATCHLEGAIGPDGTITRDDSFHMADGKIHLRNLDTNADMQWDPAAPNHSTMDTFCMSCHDSNGATSTQAAAIRALMVPAAGKTASARNPFGDTISNRYDKMQRPGVVDASSQFNTTNNSHHAVKGPRYTGRSRLAGARQIASPATFAMNSSALLQGRRSTMYDAGTLNQLYTPLENTGGEAVPRTGAATLGDDSTLHCGDCHTVGQWKVGSSTTANGSPTSAAIGAHGSNNEYLLRNSIGTDQRHTQNAFTLAAGVVTYTNPSGAFLVCYNCHNYNKYGSIFVQTGVRGGHAGEYDMQGRCNGVGNTLSFNGYTTGTATDGTQFVSRFEGPVSRYGATPAFAPGFPLVGAPPVGEQNPDFGNIFGIQCQNCHNSGAGNAYGGIHGSAKNTNTATATVPATVTGGAYIDGMGNATKAQRFLPGLGNAAYVPGTLGGFTGGTVVPINTAAGTPAYTYITGGISSDTNWEQKVWNQSLTSVIPTSGAVTNTVIAGAGCYTLGGGAPALPSTVHQGDNAAANRAIAPSVTGEGGPNTKLFETWGACDDHGAGQGRGDHGFLKKIVRPVTY
jgi:hypothetical protein